MKFTYSVITDHLLDAEGHDYFVVHGKKKVTSSRSLYRSSIFL
jgi:hypothetical protein